MTTEVIAPLPIPEQVVVGSGSYTIPANRYGFLQAFSTIASRGATWGGGTNSGMVGPTSNGNDASQWVTEGDTITSSGSHPSGSGSYSNPAFAAPINTFGYSQVSLNGNPFCYSLAGISSHFYGSATVNYSYAFDGTYGWSVSLFRIPKANLPTGAAEGEA